MMRIIGQDMPELTLAETQLPLLRPTWGASRAEEAGTTRHETGAGSPQVNPRENITLSSEAPLVIKPTLAPAALSAGILAASLFLISTGLVYLVYLPLTEQYAVVTLLGVLFLGLVAVAVWNDVVAYATQSYVIEGNTVKINVGLALKQSKSIDRSNIASVVCVMPFPARILGIGSVNINTTDGYFATMMNIRNPVDIAKRIEPRASEVSSSESKPPVSLTATVA